MEKKFPWWKEYRKWQNKPRYKLNTEMLLRKTIAECFREYSRQASTAGVKEMTCPKKTWIERLIWLVIFCGMFATLLLFLMVIRYDTLTRPLIVIRESTTYPISEIDFPAIALCNVNRISKKALKEYAKAVYPFLALHNESLEEVEDFCWHNGRLIDNTFTESLLHHKFLDNIEIRHWDTRKLIKIMERLAPKCEEILVKCSWAGKVVDCKSIFTVRRTVHGHCCAFNYVLEYNSAGKPNKAITKIKKQKVPGINNGLTVILDPQLNDSAYSLYNMEGFEVLLFDPNHFADPGGGRVIHRIAEPNRAIIYELKSLKQRASGEVRKYPVNIRKCLFQDEKPDKFNYMYSYSACLVNCRIKTIQSLCKCTPYLLPTDPDERPVCSLYDLKCLNKYKEKLHYVYPFNAETTEGLEIEMEDSLYCPDCYPDCELTEHHTKSYKVTLSHTTSFHNKSYKGYIGVNTNMTNKCYVNIFQSTPHGVLNRLDVVYYWFEILSNIGGFCGMLLGFSFISAVEIIYFLTIRFIQLFVKNILHNNK